MNADAGVPVLAAEQAAELTARAERYARELAAAPYGSPVYRAQAAAIYGLGRQSIAAAAELVREVLVPGPLSSVSARLAELHTAIESLAAGRSGIGRADVPAGLDAIDEQLVALRRDLADARASLARLDEDRARLWAAMVRIESARRFAAALAQRLPELIAGLPPADVFKAGELEREILYHVHQAGLDLQAQQVVNLAAHRQLATTVATLRLLVDAGERVAGTGVSALASARALADGRGDVFAATLAALAEFESPGA